MTTADKLRHIIAHCAWRDVEYCKDCKLELGTTCPKKQWRFWTNEEIETAYNILFPDSKEPEFVKAGCVKDEAHERFMNIGAIKDSGNRREFDTGAVRDMAEGKGRCDLLPAVAILRLARHFEKGAIKYSDRNWEKGIPLHSFIDSAIRHTMKYLDGQHDEDHLCAAAWNLICAMWTEEKHPELNDLPWAKKGETND